MTAPARATIIRFLQPLFLILLFRCGATHSLNAQVDSKAVTDALDRASDLAIHKHYQDALDAYREADRLSNHTSPDSYLGIADMECMLGDLKSAVDDAQRAKNAAGDDHLLAAQALVAGAGMLTAMASDPNDARLKEAEQEYKEAIALDPKRSIARYDLGLLMLQEGRDADGVAEMKAYVAGPFANPHYVDRANRLIADPSRARALPSEEFSFPTLEGEMISKATLRGKVVLLDFWGSWCPPCRESIPAIADLHRKFANQPVEIVGISSDDDEDQWKRFIADHQMDWPEYIDLDGQIQGLFEIHAFPTYIVLDRNGGIEFRQSGFADRTEQELEGVIKRTLTKAYAGSAAVASSSPSPAAMSAAGAAIADPGPARTVSVQFTMPPDDVENGDVRGNLYRNDFLGLSYKFPAQWTALEPEMLEQLNRIEQRRIRTAKQSGGGEPALDGSVHVAFPETIFEAAVDSRGGVPSVAIAVRQEASLTIESVRDEADAWKRDGATIVSPTAEITLGKRQFFRTDAEDEQTNPPVWIARIETLVAQHYCVELVIQARSKQELDSLVAAAQSLVILKP